MKFLAEERTTLELLLPGLDTDLDAVPLRELESATGPGIELFRKAGATGLLIPTDLGGIGASAVDALHIQRAIGSRAPSLAVASTMHHFTIATLVELWARGKGPAWMLLEGIAERRALLASGFAEGISGTGVLRPTMRARRANGKVWISGVKKPCSLARSMDILAASMLVTSEDPDVGDEFGVALISADLPGIEVTPFWHAPVLAGAESDAVTLRDVCVEEALVITMGDTDVPQLDAMQITGFLWFELLITASYIGIASALVERVLLARLGHASLRIVGAMELEAVMASLEAIAQHLGAEDTSREGLLPRTLHCRYSAQDAISRAVAAAVELLGGIAFITEDEVSYFAAASRALAFHPPGRAKIAEMLADALDGAELRIS